MLISYLIKDNVLNRAMSKKLKKILSVALVLALSMNFVLYSSQSYSPPRAESVSYSIVNCPSHENQHHSTNIVQIIIGSESENGSEKDCFCYDCCNQRVSSEIIAQSVLLVLEKHSIRIQTINEYIPVQNSHKNLPIRSPPNSVA